MPRFLLFLAWPLIEIGLFVVIGGQIGLWPTLAWVVGTALFGIVILRVVAQRGAGLLRGGFSAAAIQPGAPVNGLMWGLAAVLLILPGFLTDALAILLMLPPVQAVLKGAVLARLNMMGGNAFSQAHHRNSRGRPAAAQGDILDGEWVELPPDHPSAATGNPPSRWTEAGETGNRRDAPLPGPHPGSGAGSGARPDPGSDH